MHNSPWGIYCTVFLNMHTKNLEFFENQRFCYAHTTYRKRSRLQIPIEYRHLSTASWRQTVRNYRHLGFITATKRNDMPQGTGEWQNFNSQACTYKMLGWYMLIVKQLNSVDYCVGPLVPDRSYIWCYVKSRNIGTQEPHSEGRGVNTKLTP